MKDLIKQDIQELTNKQSYQPTAKQIEWLELAIQLKTDSPSEIEAACKEVGITTTRISWYDWKKISGFTKWFYEEWRERRREWLGELDAIGMRFAKKGSLEHWKTMRQAIGEDNQFSEEATFTWRKK